MARYLITVWPLAGHLHPMLAVAHALHGRGHTVGIYSGEAVRGIVEGEGFAFFPFDRLAVRLQEIVDGVAAGVAGADDDAFYRRLLSRYARAYECRGMARSRLLKAMSREWILGTVPQQAADLEAVTARWQPDAVLCDPTLWAPYLVLHETHRLPVAVFSLFASCMIPGPDAPPAGLGLPRPRGWRTRATARLAGLAMDVYLADIRREASELRQSYGLRPLPDSVAALSGRMPLHLVAAAPAYDYDRHDLPTTTHYVGACLWDKSRHNGPPSWLADLQDDQPLVYVSEGTAQVGASTLLQAAIRGLADLPMRVVVTTGWGRDAGDLGLVDIASNIRVEHFVAHSDLFPRASAVVTNGGSGTVRAALAHGLPLVVVPMAWDQFDNAQRVVEAGAGVRLAARRCTPERLRAAVQRVLEQPSYRAAARRMGIASADCGGPERAAALLEDLVHPAVPEATTVAAGGG